MDPTAPVAAFDFDGTLTTSDTFVPFLRRVAGGPALGAALARHAALAARGRRDEVKAAVLGQLLAGRSDAELRSAGRRHATWIERTRLRHDTVARLAWHRAQGHTTVIVSASLHHYLDPVAEALGIDHVLCTDLEVEHGRLTGRLVGGNCRRAAKAERLLAWTGGLPHELWAYGDSSGDCELLALADHPVSVRGVHLLADPAAVAG